MPWFMAVIGCASIHGGAPEKGPTESSRLEIRLAHNGVEEQRTKAQLDGLLRRYDLTPWRFTSTIIVDQETTPHSHPVLTLHTRHLRDDLLLLSTYIHEQCHRYLEMNPAVTSSVVKDLRALYPGLPVGFPDGAENLESSYEHLIVIMFERDGLVDTVGELAALQVMEFWATDHYRALYRHVLNERHKIREVLRRHRFASPGRPVP
jgi:hypothetical protein